MTAVELSANQARELTDRIKVGVEAIWELVKQAFQSRAWAALGYDSWDDYCTREFGASRIKLPREERQEVVASMREIGMSTRAIASATGTSDWTVRNELKGGARNLAPDAAPQPVTGTDGKTYTPKPRPEPEEEQAPPEWEEVGNIPQSRLNNLTPPPGFNPGDLDELNTPAPKPAPEIRKPLTDDLPDDPRGHLVNLMDDLRKAEKAIREAIFTAQKINNWSQGPVSDPLRELLDQLDRTLQSGGMDAELARLLEGEN